MTWAAHTTSMDGAMAGHHHHERPMEPDHLRRERHSHFLEDSYCAQLCLRPNPMMARYIYALIFLVTNLLAWTIRDYGHSVLSELQRLKGCQGTHYCLGAEGVLRISLGCFLFFFVMFLSTVSTRKVQDARNSWHSEWWPAKVILWMGFMVIPFFIPSAFVQLYGKVAHFGAGLRCIDSILPFESLEQNRTQKWQQLTTTIQVLAAYIRYAVFLSIWMILLAWSLTRVFLMVQLISVISFITWLNDCCRSEENLKRCHVQVLVISIVAYIASILGIVLMYVWYAPSPTCTLNILFITLTLALVQVLTCISLNSKVKEGYLAPGLMGVYVVFLCWSAIRSEPHTEICNKKAEAATSADWLNIASFVIAVLVIVMATFSTGIDSNCFQFKKTEVVSEDDVPYGFGFFHFVFAMGAMYFGMLFVGWNAHRTMHKWTIDVGWASTWVRIANQWLAAIVYVWMLVAPIIWKRRRVESTHT